MVDRLVEVGERVLGGVATPAAAVAALVADTIERAPLPEPVRRALIARVDAVTQRLGDGVVAPDPSELRQVVEQFRSQRLVAATQQLQRAIERLSQRIEMLDDTEVAEVLRARAAELSARLTGVADVAGIRALVAELRDLVYQIVGALRHGES